MEFLAREVASIRMALGEVATRDFLRSELRSLMHDLEDRYADDGAGAGEGTGSAEGATDQPVGWEA
jgi:hypothetical protein